MSNCNCCQTASVTPASLWSFVSLSSTSCGSMALLEWSTFTLGCVSCASRSCNDKFSIGRTGFSSTADEVSLSSMSSVKHLLTRSNGNVNVLFEFIDSAVISLRPSLISCSLIAPISLPLPQFGFDISLSNKVSNSSSLLNLKFFAASKPHNKSKHCALEKLWKLTDSENRLANPGFAFIKCFMSLS
eukprot:NODE_456_length_8237_cov_0.078398.p3 type:complete len:187 gc:universal NODE_456_length_8237_cov_0.078398:6335-5775(-)